MFKEIEIQYQNIIEHFSNTETIEKISLYQYSEYKRNNISISKDKNVIVFTAQYMGPEIDHTNYFDFA
ncbi:unnamed protein product, partial [marine sediment metagenome]